MGPLDQGGRRQFWGEGVRSSRRVWKRRRGIEQVGRGVHLPIEWTSEKPWPQG